MTVSPRLAGAAPRSQFGLPSLRSDSTGFRLQVVWLSYFRVSKGSGQDITGTVSRSGRCEPSNQWHKMIFDYAASYSVWVRGDSSKGKVYKNMEQALFQKEIITNKHIQKKLEETPYGAGLRAELQTSPVASIFIISFSCAFVLRRR